MLDPITISKLLLAVTPLTAFAAGAIAEASSDTVSWKSVISTAIGAIVPIIGAIAILLSKIKELKTKADANEIASKEIHTAVNSSMTELKTEMKEVKLQLVESLKTNAAQQGTIEGILKAR